MKNRSLFVRRFGMQPLLHQKLNTSLISASVIAKNPSLASVPRLLCALALILTTLGLSSCHSASYYYYKFPEYTYAGRPVPPSKLAQRVMIGETLNGSVGALQIVDALRDIRSNIQNTTPSFQITGYQSGYPETILNFPSELRGYVYSSSDGSLVNINYSTEAAAGPAGTFQSGSNSIAIPTAFTRFYGAEEAAGVLEVIDNLTGASYGLNIPNVYKVVANKGDTVALAMVRNSNLIYRVFKLNQNQFPTQQTAMAATGATDCQPALLPVYCAVALPPGPTGTYDHPTNVYYSLDGTIAYVLNCGPECGGTTASVTLLQQGPLNENIIPSSPAQPNPMIANVLVPGGVTAALSDGTTLYLAGQQRQSDLLFAGFLSTMNLATNTITGKYSIADGNHSKLLFADNNTLWIASEYCATGERKAKGLNYNCLSMVVLNPATPAAPVVSAQIVPNVTPGSPTAVVPYPNQNFDQYYYGSLTGLCWVEGYNKVYTAYGGQIHVFKTTDGSEIDNQYVAVQGTALDVAYMDATTDDAD